MVSPIIKNIIFDVSEVLTKHLHGPEWSDRLLAEEYGVPFKKIRDFFDEFGRVGGKVHGMSIEEFWKIKTTIIDPISLSAIMASARRYEDDIVIDKKMINLLLRLQPSYRLFTLTNTWKPGHAFQEQLQGYFEAFVQTSDINIRKPDIAVYKYMCNTYNLKPEETLFIDNKLKNIDAAQKYGMHAIHFTSPQRLEKELRILAVIT